MQQIIALGGGGFSMEPDNPALDQYVIDQTGKASPSVCFLGQAGAENPDYALRFYQAFARLGARPTHLALYGWPVVDPEPILLAQDVIYVGGGNTRNMLALWQAWDLPRILRQALENGTVLAGISAGANCWFEQGITDSIAPELGVMACLGWLPGSFCPHYDGEVQRRPTFHRLLAEDRVKPGYAADDGAAFHFVDGSLHKIVSSRPNARGYRLEKREGNVVEESIGDQLFGGGVRTGGRQLSNNQSSIVNCQLSIRLSRTGTMSAAPITTKIVMPAVAPRHSPLATRYFQVRRHAFGTDNDENSDVSSRHSPLAIFRLGAMPSAPITTKIVTPAVATRHSPLVFSCVVIMKFDTYLVSQDLPQMPALAGCC